MDSLMLFSPAWTLASPCIVLLLKVVVQLTFQASHSSRDCCRTHHAFTPQRKEPAGCCSPSAPLHTRMKLAIRYGQLTVETMPRNGRKDCPLPLQTLTLSCAGSLLQGSRCSKVWVGTGTRAFSTTEGPYRPHVLLTGPKEWLSGDERNILFLGIF